MSPSQDASEKPANRKRRRLPPPLVQLVVLLLVLAIAVLRTFGPHLDHPAKLDGATINVLTLILAFAALVSLGGWFVLRSGYSRQSRWLTAGLTILLVAGLAASLRIEQVSGNLVPRFRFRWSPKPDALLELPQAAGPPVDLRTTTPDDFPQFLGPGRDLKVLHIQLARTWDSDPPQPLWRQPIGAGWSAFSAVNGFAVTMEQRGREELVTCYEVRTGKLRWVHAIQSRHETLLGGPGPRSTPTINEGRVYALGPTGIVRCLDGATGKLLWQKDLLRQYGIASPEEDMKEVAWGRAASPLVVDQWVVVPAGGPRKGRKVSLVAFDKRTGEVAWEGGDQQVSYSSPALAVLAGRRQVLIVNESTASGHAVDGPRPGCVLWTCSWPGDSSASASASQAVPVPPDGVFLSKGYGGGAALMKIVPQDDGNFAVEPVWRRPSVLKTKLTNVVIHDGYVYGLSDGILECVELQTGQRMWKRGRYGHGQILLVGDVLLVQTESGRLVMVEATPQELRELGSFQALNGKSWNNLCLYGQYLLLRNARQAACYRLPLADAIAQPGQ